MRSVLSRCSLRQSASISHIRTRPSTVSFSYISFRSMFTNIPSVSSSPMTQTLTDSSNNNNNSQLTPNNASTVTGSSISTASSPSISTTTVIIDHAPTPSTSTSSSSSSGSASTLMMGLNALGLSPSPSPLSPSKEKVGGFGSTDDEDSVESDAWELMLNSVVKVFCTSTSPNYAQPWQMKRQSSSTSSGFVVSGKRIIGNAHGVTNSSSIRVRKHGDAKKYPAAIEFISHESDLAILTVPDPTFWIGLTPLDLGGVPRLHSNVSVAGYPTGGDNLSVTKGVVSRVVVGSYSHSGENLLCVQIDAAINSGNSGGPAMQGNKVVGVAFETLSSAQNIGYIIPTPVIRHFLNDIERNNRYTSFPRLGFTWQKMENDSLRKAFKMPEDKHGVLISSVEPLDTCANILHRDDVLISLDNIPIADDGTIFFRRGERVSFRYIESTKYVGEDISACVIRDGKEIEVRVNLEARKALCPLHLHDQLPSYYVHAGLVFTVLSRSYLAHEWGKDWHKKAPVELVEHAYYGVLNQPDQQIVILSQILVDDINTGYQSTFHNLRVLKVNGVLINNLAQIVQIVESASKNGESFLRFDLDRDKVVCLETELALSATNRILKQNNIGSAKSIDLMTPEEKTKLLSQKLVSPHVSPKLKMRASLSANEASSAATSTLIDGFHDANPSDSLDDDIIAHSNL